MRRADEADAAGMGLFGCVGGGVGVGRVGGWVVGGWWCSFVRMGEQSVIVGYKGAYVPSIPIRGPGVADVLST